LAANTRSQGKEALAVSTDVRNPISVDALFSRSESSCGRIVDQQDKYFPSMLIVELREQFAEKRVVLPDQVEDLVQI
jgi:hypothetical protein